MGTNADNGTTVRRRPSSAPSLVAVADVATQLDVASTASAPVIADIQSTLGNAIVEAALLGAEGWHADVASTVTLGIVGGATTLSGTPNHQIAARLQRHGSEHRDVGDVLATLPQSSGFGLSGEMLERFELAFEHDFGHVQLHTDGVAAEAAKALNAYAFALGSDIYFGSGTFAPGTRRGDQLLAHELTHVVQYDENRLPTTSSGDDQVSSPSDPTEREAYANEKVIMGRLDRVDRVAAAEHTQDPAAQVYGETIPSAVEQRWASQLGAPVEADTGGGQENLWNMASALGAAAFMPEAQTTAAEGEVVQQRSTGAAAMSDAAIKQEARSGASGAGAKLPFLEQIQAAFGHHDVTGVQAHTGTAAAQATDAMGARAYAIGEDIAFGSSPDLHTAAHEAAHVIQQRAGVSVEGGVGAVGDAYERHADAVADAVVAGQSAEGLLDGMATSASEQVSAGAVGTTAVQFIGGGEADKAKGDDYANNVQKLVNDMAAILEGSGLGPFVGDVISELLTTINENRPKCAVTSSLASAKGEDTNTAAYGSLKESILAALSPVQALFEETDKTYFMEQLKVIIPAVHDLLGTLAETAVDLRVAAVIREGGGGDPEALAVLDESLPRLQQALQRRVKGYLRQLMERNFPGSKAPDEVVQKKATGSAATESAQRVHAQAEAGVAGGGSALPHLARIQAAFGDHDVSGVKAHSGSAASKAAGAIGAQAYATGEDIAFGSSPDLHTAAHEAAHVVQQRQGVSLGDGLGQAGDRYEQHADAVADAVVAGQSAEALLGPTETASASASTDLQATGSGPRVLRQDDDFSASEVEKRGGKGKKSYIDDAGNLNPANPDGHSSPLQHIMGGIAEKNDSPFTSFMTVEEGVQKNYGSQEIQIDVQRLMADITSGAVAGVEVILPARIQASIIAELVDLGLTEGAVNDAIARALAAGEVAAVVTLVESSGLGKKKTAKAERRMIALYNTTRDQELLIKGIIPSGYITRNR